MVRFYDDSAAQYVDGLVTVASTTALRLRYMDDAVAGVNDVNTAATTPFTIANLDTFFYSFSVPLSPEWA